MRLQICGPHVSPPFIVAPPPPRLHRGIRAAREKEEEEVKDADVRCRAERSPPLHLPCTSTPPLLPYDLAPRDHRCVWGGGGVKLPKNVNELGVADVSAEFSHKS